MSNIKPHQKILSKYESKEMAQQLRVNNTLVEDSNLGSSQLLTTLTLEGSKHQFCGHLNI